ncbi:MAG: hypothetical protein HOC92_19255 [Gammaproteobacteria bacterium]|nr:hypothetical protein [Gammaproteobacteria bacterium]MBT4451845.1 hypothetical protein [Gammaproteobacteria bacterium]MBT7047511.1 hypothetical protein [Gammaproteobacteria bacterium]
MHRKHTPLTPVVNPLLQLYLLLSLARPTEQTCGKLNNITVVLVRSEPFTQTSGKSAPFASPPDKTGQDTANAQG